jgi:hypothetical protein
MLFHGLLSVVLIGAVSHQALSLWKPRPAEAPRSLFASFRTVRSMAYTNSIVVLYAITVIGGAVLYPFYVLDAKKPLLDMGLNYALGVFEIKEHLAIVGLGLLPAYARYWARAECDRDLRVRRILTVLIAVTVWWNFVVGHVLNTMRGVF